jgi:hypothetical protein
MNRKEFDKKGEIKMRCSRYCINLNTFGECNLDGCAEKEHCFKVLSDEHNFRKSGMIGYRNEAFKYRLLAEQWQNDYDDLKNKYEPEILIPS